ncbi:MAG TPA: hypothetical protein VL625_06725 [Patescibacteria group bacterium]|nr:hypothetical protein [Patescibacteria group bacterium]
MTSSKDDTIDALSDEQILNLPSTSLSAEQAVKLAQRLAEIEEDSLWGDDPAFHGLPLFRNLRWQREREKERREKEIEDQRHEELKRSKHGLEKHEFQDIMLQVVVHFRDVAKRACRWGTALLAREIEIRSRAITLGDGTRVYVDGSGFVDEQGRELTDSSAIAEAQAKKKPNSATSHELQVAARAHALADKEITIEQQASQGARDAEDKRKTGGQMTPPERTVTAASAGEHADDLGRAQSSTEQQAKELMNWNTASLAAGAALPGVIHGGGAPATPPEIPACKGCGILNDVGNAFAAAIDSTKTTQTKTSGLRPEPGSLKNEFSVAIAPPRNDNTSSTRETVTTDSIPPMRQVIL